MEVWMPFNSMMMQFFKNGDIDQLIQLIFTHIKTQVEKPQMLEEWFYVISNHVAVHQFS